MPAPAQSCGACARATYKEGQGGDGPRSTPTIDDGIVYALGAEGKLFALQAASNVELMNGRCWTVPALVNGTLYVRDESEIVAVDLLNAP